MNRLHMIVAIGLFLIVALFGWQSYLEKSAHRNRSETRGLPTGLIKDIKQFEASDKAQGKTAMPEEIKIKKTDKVVQPATSPTP